jgi:hypothetical protein
MFTYAYHNEKERRYVETLIETQQDLARIRPITLEVSILQKSHRRQEVFGTKLVIRKYLQ